MMDLAEAAECKGADAESRQEIQGRVLNFNRSRQFNVQHFQPKSKPQRAINGHTTPLDDYLRQSSSHEQWWNRELRRW